MRKVKTRDGIEKHEPYPIGEFTPAVIESICKRIVHLKAVGKLDMSGDEFSRMFREAISGISYGKPMGIADVAWNGCAWSVKTVQNRYPHEFTVYTGKKNEAPKVIRLVSGRNSPIYSAGIKDPMRDIQATGQAVLDVYNDRINKAKWDHDDIRMIVLVRNMGAQEFTLFERPIVPFVVNEYRWEVNKDGNLVGYAGDRHAFTWQPHGSQFTIHEHIPAGATRFRINKEPPLLMMDWVLRLAKFKPDWVEIIDG